MNLWNWWLDVVGRLFASVARNDGEVCLPDDPLAT
jgi:hypothetical protein